MGGMLSSATGLFWGLFVFYINRGLCFCLFCLLCFCFWLAFSGSAKADRPGLTCYPCSCGAHYIVSKIGQRSARYPFYGAGHQRPKVEHGHRYAPKFSCKIIKIESFACGRFAFGPKRGLEFKPKIFGFATTRAHSPPIHCESACHGHDDLLSPRSAGLKT